MLKLKDEFNRISRISSLEYRKDALVQFAEKFKLFKKCDQIAYWLMTDYKTKKHGGYNICSKAINNRRIKIQSDTFHPNLWVEHSSSKGYRQVINYHSGSLKQFLAEINLLVDIDILFAEAMKVKQKKEEIEKRTANKELRENFAL